MFKKHVWKTTTIYQLARLNSGSFEEKIYIYGFCYKF